MALRFEIRCNKCNHTIILDVEPNHASLRVYCKNCKIPIFDNTRQPKKMPAIPVTSDRININQATELIFNKTQDRIDTEMGVTGQTQQRIPRQPSQPPKQNQKFGKYTLLKTLGSGAMGNVYLATNDETKEQVALKVLKPSPEGGNLLDYFIREVQVLIDLDHPNIVTLKDWGNHLGYPFLAMEYIAGTSLENFIEQKGPVSPVHAAQMISYILDALTYAYSEFKLIHRDIKPANILISQTGVVKLIDLGLGKIIVDSIGNLTKTGQIMGTGYYMPEEQLKNAKDANHRSDIYAVGATLYNILCGIPPYEEHGKNIQKLIHAKIKGTYIKLAERNLQIPMQIVKIVDKAMAHHAKDRYATSQEMKEELMEFHQNHSGKN